MQVDSRITKITIFLIFPIPAWYTAAKDTSSLTPEIKPAALTILFSFEVTMVICLCAIWIHVASPTGGVLFTAQESIFASYLEFISL